MHSKENIQQAINAVMDSVRAAQLSDCTIKTYDYHFKRLVDYLEAYETREINEEFLLQFLRDCFGINIPSLKAHGIGSKNARRVRPISVLNEYLEKGKYIQNSRQYSRLFLCPDGFLESYTLFLESLKKKGLQEPTIKTNKRLVEEFISYLQLKDVSSEDMVSACHATGFFAGFKNRSAKYAGVVLYVLRNYLRFLYDGGYVETDLSEILPSLHIPRNGGIPHAWTKQELRDLLLAVDREDPAGKRDYAILLLTIQTGLRAADIRRLKISDINWESHMLRTMTAKTMQEVLLPIMDGTGWAIIDYLKNGRPQTCSDRLFVRHCAPFNALGSTATLDAMLSKYMRKAGIAHRKGERCGIHTLRSTLAKNMLDSGAPLPVISQTLAHRDTNTTAIYLKIDVEGLRKCALDPCLGGGCA